MMIRLRIKAEKYPPNKTKTGNVLTKTREPREMYPVAQMRKMQRIKDSINGSGVNAIKMPNVVATPLPPLRLRKMECMWPRIRATPDRVMKKKDWLIARAISIGIYPLAMSRIKVITP
jgi:hypothetical protein